MAVQQKQTCPAYHKENQMDSTENCLGALFLYTNSKGIQNYEEEHVYQIRGTGQA